MRFSRWTLLFVGIAAAIVLLGFALYSATSKKSDAAERQETITYSTDKPSEQKPADNYVWLGAMDEPKKIRIPSLGIDGFVQRVGVDQNKEVAVPNNIHMAGWFIDTVRPGQKGLSVIDGHVNGPTVDDGIFRDLDELKLGDMVGIERGDGTRVRYEVLTVVSVPTDQAVGSLFSQDPTVASQLNLITCGGTWSQDTREYDQRIVVSAKLVE